MSADTGSASGPIKRETSGMPSMTLLEKIPPTPKTEASEPVSFKPFCPITLAIR